MKIGIVGTGRMAEARAKCVLAADDVDLAWICSRSEERGAAFLQELKEPGSTADTTVYSSYETAFLKGGAMAAIITSPNGAHHAVAQAAFDARLSVLLEYPPAVSPEDGVELTSLARKAGVTYAIGLTHLFGGKHQVIASYCHGEEPLRLGRPRLYQYAFCSGNPISRWYDRESLSGGMFISSLYHYIDEALDFLGEPQAQCSSYYINRSG